MRGKRFRTVEIASRELLGGEISNSHMLWWDSTDVSLNSRASHSLIVPLNTHLNEIKDYFVKSSKSADCPGITFYVWHEQQYLGTAFLKWTIIIDMMAKLNSSSTMSSSQVSKESWVC